MLFNSMGFLIFFSVFFFVYWKTAKYTLVRNIILLIASLVLYYLWDIRSFAILATVITFNYFLARSLSRESKSKKLIFIAAILFNVTPLIIFKYYNFFISSINDVGTIFGLEFNLVLLKLFLPVGISFYTFLSLSYLIDIYKKQFDFEPNFINHSLSLSYFPIILSGPIHRPRYLLKQLRSNFNFDYALVTNGLRQFLWGLFTKVAVADTLAKYVERAFSDNNSLNGNSILIGSVYFSFQLYFDFNGYSNMAIGISKMLGISIERNFQYPYLSRTIADFWKKWHISLTKWFRDYIFLPISFIFSRRFDQGSMFNTDIAIYSFGIIITWTLTGLWHGANWTFIVWGVIHAVFLILNKAFRKKKKKLLKILKIKHKNKILIFFEGIVTFIIVNFAWIYFRSDSVSTGNSLISKILNTGKWGNFQLPLLPLLVIILVLIIEKIQINKDFVLDISRNHFLLRWLCYIIVTTIVLYYSGNGQTFIYAGF